MTIQLSSKAQELLSREGKAFAFLALTMADGTPQVTPIWFDWDGAHIIINTARKRVKDRVMHRRANVALSIPDPHDPYKYMLIRGRVVHETEEGGYEQICRLNEKYHGKNEYPRRPGEVRVTYRILPEQVYPRQ